MAAIGDVARLAGVSKATASRALSGGGYVAEETRRKVQAAAREIGYIASPDAASLVTGRTKNIGVIIPFVNRWFFGEVLEGAERALLAAGYDLTLYNLALEGPERDRVFDFFLARKRVDAVIAVGVDLDAREVEVIGRRDKPIVALGGSAPGAPRLAVDDRAAGRLATEHLIQLGHTRIAHIAGAAPGSAAGVAHANHCLHPALAVFNQQFPELIQSHARDRRIRELVDLTSPTGLSVEIIQAALRDHENFPRSICRHQNDDPATGIWETVFSVIIDVDQRRMLVSRGTPCNRAYESYSLN